MAQGLCNVPHILLQTYFSLPDLVGSISLTLCSRTREMPSTAKPCMAAQDKTRNLHSKHTKWAFFNISASSFHCAGKQPLSPRFSFQGRLILLPATAAELQWEPSCHAGLTDRTCHQGPFPLPMKRKERFCSYIPGTTRISFLTTAGCPMLH